MKAIKKHSLSRLVISINIFALVSIPLGFLYLRSVDNRISEVREFEVPLSLVSNTDEVHSGLETLRSHVEADILFLGEYYQDRDAAAIRISIDPDLWISEEENPPLIPVLEGTFEANAVGECKEVFLDRKLHDDKILARLGVTYFIACPATSTVKSSVLFLGAGWVVKPEKSIREIQDSLTQHYLKLNVQENGS